MAYLTYTKDPIGRFIEKDTGNVFEYSLNDEPLNSHLGEDFLHKVWVNSGQIGGDTGWRFATVQKTVVTIVVDEDEYGLPVTEKWYIKGHNLYDNSIMDMVEQSRMNFLMKL